MYEDKRTKLKINWKSLLIKMAILLVVVFLLIWIVSLVTKKKDVPSNIDTNLKLMQDAAMDYFTESRLPKTLNSKKSITLKEMLDMKLLLEFKDQNGEACDMKESYAEATKISDSDYTIKVKLVCGEENDYVINTISVKNQNNDVVQPEEQPQDNNEVDNSSSNTQTSSNSSNNSTKKPSTSKNTSTNSSSKKPTVTSSTSTSNTNTSNTSTTTSTGACNYGTSEYTAYYPLAYVIGGNCAVSKDDYYSQKYASTVNNIGNNEYRKLKSEIDTLAKNSGALLSVEMPSYNGVYNKTNTGLVGYQIVFTVKQQLTYTTRVIYKYYLDQYGNRRAIIDDRSSIGYTSVSDDVKISLNTSSKVMNVGDKFSLVASVSPSSKIVSWNSSDESVATVGSSGTVIAKNAGVTTITASVGNGKTKESVSAKITVVDNNVYVNKVSLNVASKTLYIGDKFTLVASVSPSNANNQKVTWTSGNNSIAVVDSNGVVTAKGEGVVSICATVDGKKAYATIIVKAYDYLEITDNTTVIALGETHKIGIKTNISNLRFITSNKNVLKLNSDGSVTAVGKGVSTITIIGNGITREITFIVK